jgi:hypothetical protein
MMACSPLSRGRYASDADSMAQRRRHLPPNAGGPLGAAYTRHWNGSFDDATASSLGAPSRSSDDATVPRGRACVPTSSTRHSRPAALASEAVDDAAYEGSRGRR